MKDAVLEFFKMLTERKVIEAYDKFVAKDFIHHNQYFKGDRESLMLGMDEAHRENPNATIEVKRLFQDGDFVISHSLVKMNAEHTGFATVHIFRFRGDKIVEFWDVPMAIETEVPNENGLF